MGNFTSKLQRDAFNKLETMVKEHPIAVAKEQLRDLVFWIKQQFPNSDPDLLFTPYVWDSIHLRQYNAASHGNGPAAKLLPIRRVVYEVIASKNQIEQKPELIVAPHSSKNLPQPTQTKKDGEEASPPSQAEAAKIQADQKESVIDPEPAERCAGVAGTIKEKQPTSEEWREVVPPLQRSGGSPKLVNSADPGGSSEGSVGLSPAGPQTAEQTDLGREVIEQQELPQASE
ncbi:uncharacterized protein LOC120411466 [Corvus cornix cornix]|uniref:uncharacterized protein LOC120411466 n=1 Tax=Corvus cornix cornix TaxID=932674 RepID=UPI001951AB33|nr:uncharacterized protein LOC120411466 [Corvus cornix cornix]